MNQPEEMLVSGKYSQAKVFTKNIDDETIGQIQRLVDHPYSEGSQIRIMPDTHIGKGAVVGTTMTFTDKIVPNVVGVDIGCGMLVAELGDIELGKNDFKALDDVIRKVIPSGTGIRQKPHFFLNEANLEALTVKLSDIDRVQRSIGTLGGGNHFIEVNQDEKGSYYLDIHSGSRSLGQEVANYHQQRAVSYWNQKKPDFDMDFAYLEKDEMNTYLNDMAIAQHYAHLNRKAMMQEITTAMDWEPVRTFDVVHNYVDIANRIIRKGAISSQNGEEVIIPINMRDGSILAIGKGNPDWNYSAPHGAGRLLSRTQARKMLKMNDFQQAMKGIYTTSVRKATLDEMPDAYKPMAEILAKTAATVMVKAILKPVYNFKA
ncbi:RtcB family protein [Jeotgalibaca sp. A127]|uniref:RtcB family protein n=1 Tax=Jeotgalibaca sp. A127 TaxID=3457324 RepID=UPI003FD48378